MNGSHRQARWQVLTNVIRALLPGERAISVLLCNSRSTAQLLLLFVIASVPAALVGAWSSGAAWIAASADAAGWRQQLLAILGSSADSPAAALFAGLTFLVPLFLVAAATGAFWETVFATARRRSVDPGWLMSGWLFALLLPAQTPLVFAAIGMSFGAVIGQQVFGGTGRYIASPAAIGALFLHFAYPVLAPATTSWGLVSAQGAAQAMADGVEWIALFAGRESGMLGTTSALACMFGAALLAFTGSASMRTLAGGLIGIFLAGWLAAELGGTLPPHWHFALGNAAFCWAFVLTDPTTLPLTRSGRWLHGFAFGSLIVLMREGDPMHPESALFAVLLAALLVPLIDYVTLRVTRRRRGGTLEIAR